MSWVSPTGHEDPDEFWANEDHLYDEDTGTYAASGTTPPDSWTSFVHLTHAALQSNKIRFYATPAVGIWEDVDVDVYKDGAWVHVYQGSFSDGWNEKTFSQGSVTKARVRFYNKFFVPGSYIGFKEFDFWEVAAPPPGGGVAHPYFVLAKGPL